MDNEQLVTRIKAGIDPSENMLALYNQMKGLIYTIAKHYSGMAELDDLTQEGYIALCDAVEYYKPEEGTKFSSYAGVVIRRHMTRYIRHDSTVIIQESAHGKIYKYDQVRNAFMMEVGRYPTDREIRYYLRISDKQLECLKKAEEMSRIASLDSFISDKEEELTLCDTIAGEEDTEQEVTDRIQQEQLKAAIWEAVDSLSGEQPDVIHMRYQDNMTLQAISDSLGLTRERVRRTEAKALRNLRTCHRRKIAPYLPEHLEASAYSGNGVAAFNRTWTSSTERIALKL